MDSTDWNAALNRLDSQNWSTFVFAFPLVLVREGVERQHPVVARREHCSGHALVEEPVKEKVQPVEVLLPEQLGRFGFKDQWASSKAHVDPPVRRQTVHESGERLVRAADHERLRAGPPQSSADLLRVLGEIVVLFREFVAIAHGQRVDKVLVVRFELRQEGDARKNHHAERVPPLGRVGERLGHQRDLPTPQKSWISIPGFILFFFIFFFFFFFLPSRSV